MIDDTGFATPQGGAHESSRHDAVETGKTLALKRDTIEPREAMTSNQGLKISDDQNSEKAGVRGGSLLEDFLLREKITAFDHERIPERVVHARGAGAHGYFEAYEDLSALTMAAPFTEKGKRTPVFTRFSTVAGSRGSADTPRDVRGFAVKFYTEAGVWDLVGNDIPVFFINDAIKFPGSDPRREARTPRRDTASGLGPRHVLGLRLPVPRDQPHGDVGDERPRAAAVLRQHGRLRGSHLAPRGREGRQSLRQVPLEAREGRALSGVGRGSEDGWEGP